MSLSIDVDRVREVLLADGWHRVVDSTFRLDAYEFFETRAIGSERDYEYPHVGGQSGICATGFAFFEYLSDSDATYPGAMRRVSGPLTAVLAVTEPEAST